MRIFQWITLTTAINCAASAFTLPSDFVGRAQVNHKVSRNAFFVSSSSALSASSEVTVTSDQADYAEFLELKRRKSLIQSTPLFTLLEPDDLSRVAAKLEKVKVKAGEIIIQQGAMEDDMFLVVDGTYVCYGLKENEGIILKTYDESGSYFGELGLFFSKPRALSIRASSDGTLLKFTREAFDSAVIESDISSDVLGLLYEAYGEESVWGALPKLSLEELREALVVKSRPKKLPVSLHSTLSILAFGFYVASMIPQFNPGYDQALNIPHIFKLIDDPNEAIMKQQLLAMWALAITGIMGLFRLPPRSPNSRRAFFLGCAFLTLAQAIVCSSNITGATVWFFDAWSAPWNVLVPLSSVLGVIIQLWSIDEAIVGDMRQRDTLPLIETRIGAVFFYSITCFLFCALTQIAITPLYSDRATFEEVAVPLLRENNLVATQLSTFALTTGSNSVAALLATLRFEKKMSFTQSRVIGLLCAIFFFFDGANLLFSQFNSQDLYYSLNQEGARYFFDMTEKFHVFDGCAVAIGFTILNAFYRKYGMATSKEMPE